MIYLDSAIIADAKKAVLLGWVKGITTNPKLINKSPLSPEETLTQLAKISPGELYYQLFAQDFEGMVTEAKKAAEIVGDKLVLKILPTEIGFRTVAHLSSEINCSITAIFSAAQAVVAKEVGAKYAIPYVNRVNKQLGDGLGIALVKQMSNLLQGSNTRILAASIISPSQAAATLEAGAHHLTIDPTVLEQMLTHDFSAKAAEDFYAHGAGIGVDK